MSKRLSRYSNQQNLPIQGSWTCKDQPNPKNDIPPSTSETEISTNLNSGSYTPLLRRDMNLTTQSASGPMMKAPRIAPIREAIETNPTPETEKLYGGAVKIKARTLPTTINQLVVKP